MIWLVVRGEELSDLYDIEEKIEMVKKGLLSCNREEIIAERQEFLKPHFEAIENGTDDGTSLNINQKSF